jgi:hypothetical protein
MSEWVKAALSDGSGGVDVVELAQAALREHGIVTERVKHDLHVAELGLVLEPRGIGVDPAARDGVQTTTIVRVSHPRVFVTPIFEYQHGTGDSLASSLSSAFELWAQLDFPVLADATRDQPESCTMMKMEFPGGRARRVLLGPTARYGEAPSDEGEHCFCPCCLTTNCFEAFKSLIEGEGTYALRLYAARDPEGKPMADCRVNGENYDPGKGALEAYARTWGGSGFEFRKQYVIMQNS